ncbi:polysaccharide deacetylase family protein [Candidatus Shapirobacteria bacterium]|nr:polysaccharide deacetylase family protein [Candidatus Shapirobacteria bacterium]
MIRATIFFLRSLLYHLTYSISSKTPDKIILCYHSVGGPSWDYNVKLNDFKDQIDYLLTLYQPTTLDKIITATAPSFVLTFDDGYKSIFKIHEFLKTENIYPTLFLLSDKKNLNHQEIDNNISLLKNHQVRKLIASGWKIGSHGSQHQDYWQLKPNEISSEIVKSKSDLEKRFGVPISCFSYPKGRYSPAIIDAVKNAGYKMAATMDDGILDKTTNLYTIPRIGVDKTLNIDEFKRVLAISTITARGIVKKLGGKLLAKLI